MECVPLMLNCIVMAIIFRWIFSVMILFSVLCRWFIILCVLLFRYIFIIGKFLIYLYNLYWKWWTWIEIDFHIVKLFNYFSENENLKLSDISRKILWTTVIFSTQKFQNPTLKSFHIVEQHLDLCIFLFTFLICSLKLSRFFD